MGDGASGRSTSAHKSHRSHKSHLRQPASRPLPPQPAITPQASRRHALTPIRSPSPLIRYLPPKRQRLRLLLRSTLTQMFRQHLEIAKSIASRTNLTLLRPIDRPNGHKIDGEPTTSCQQQAFSLESKSVTGLEQH